jgi:hypothetical protein
MPPFLWEDTEDNAELTRQGFDRLVAPLSEAVAASAEESWVRSPTSSLIRHVERRAENVDVGSMSVGMGEFGMLADEPPPESPALSPLIEPDEANARFAIPGDPKFKFDAPVREREAELLRQQRMEELQRRDVIGRAEGGLLAGAALLGTDLAVTLLDPINVASAFVPVVGPARYAMMAERFGTVGARAARGAIEGAAGAALVEPIVYSVAQEEFADYGALDSLLNVAFGTVIGGGLHVTAGALGDLLARADHRTREALLRNAVADAAEGRVVTGSDEILRMDPGLRETLIGSTALSRADFAGRIGADMGPAVEVPEFRAPEPERSLIAYAKRDGQPKIMDRESDAERFVRKRSEAGEEGLAVVPTEDGRFAVMRETAAEPVRDPSGTPKRFESERAAQKYIDRVLDGSKEHRPAMFGPTGPDRHWIVLRGANAADVNGLRASPGTARFAARPRPAVEAKGTPGEALVAVARRKRDVSNIRLADTAAAAEAERVFREIPQRHDAEAARREADDLIREIEQQLEGMGSGRDELRAALAEADRGLDDAEAFGRAAHAAAICGLKH